MNQCRSDWISTQSLHQPGYGHEPETEGLNYLHTEICKGYYHQVCVYHYDKVPWNMQTLRAFIAPQALPLPIYNRYTFTVASYEEITPLFEGLAVFS